MPPIPLRWHVLVIGLVTVGCGVPDDELFTPPVAEPDELLPGLYRLTLNDGPDVVRGFEPTGERVVYRSRGLAGFGDDWRILSVPREGGQVTEVAGLYRAALRNPPGHAEVQPERRILTLWREPTDGVESCRDCPPAPDPIGLSIVRLDPTDGRALSALPTRTFFLPNFLEGPGPCTHRIRLTPAEVEVRSRGTNPFGPTMLPTSAIGYYSDGDAVWRFDLERPEIPAESLGPGLFPAVSADGRFVAAAMPMVSDSTSDFCIVGLCPCIQETVQYAVPDWTVRVYDIEAGTARDLGSGLEPRFHPTEPKLLVRRAGGLYWVDLETGAADSVSNTSGAFAAAIAPDGSRLAFSTNLFGNADVFVLELSRDR